MAQQTLTIDQMYALARSVGFSVAGATKAAMVGEAESSGRTWITSPNPDGGTNVGIMQLDTRGVGAGHSVQQLQDPTTNMQLAFKDSKDGTDWGHWATWPTAAAKYATQAQAAAAKDSPSFIQQGIAALGAGVAAAASSAQQSSGGGGGLLGLPTEVTGFFTGLEAPIEALQWFVNPTNWARMVAGAVGALLLIAGLITLGMAA